MFLSFSDSKTETSKEILLKVFLKKTFNFRFPTTQYFSRWRDERAILERFPFLFGKPVLGNDKLL
jgi:hypothetical protein